MTTLIQPPEYYLDSLKRKIQWRVDNWNMSRSSMKHWRLSIDKLRNRHVDSNGKAWGWYEISPLGIEVGYWGENKDDLRGFDIQGWNKLASELVP